MSGRCIGFVVLGVVFFLALGVLQRSLLFWGWFGYSVLFFLLSLTIALSVCLSGSVAVLALCFVSSLGQVEMRLRQLEGGARLLEAAPKTPTQVNYFSRLR